MKSRAIFLIQLFLWLSLFLTLGTPAAHAAMSQAQEVQAVQSLEDTLFAMHYDQDSLNDRLSRIEETVFGQAQSGALEPRITRLQGSLSPKALGPLSPLNKNPAASDPAKNNAPQAATANPNFRNNSTPSKPGANAPQQVASNSGSTSSGMGNLNKMSPNTPAGAKNAATPTATGPEPGETDYPTVSQMELKQFGKTFPKEDIGQRLNRLENQVFKTPQSGSLADRTDNLRMVVLGDVGQSQPMANAYSQNTYNQPSNSYNSGYGYSSGYGQPPSQGSYGYPQAPNYGGYGNASGSSAYGGPPQTAYSLPGSYNSAPGNGGSAGQNGMNPIPGYGNNAGTPPGTTNVNYQPTDSANGQVTPDMMAAMTEVEKEVLGSTYPSEPINARLDRVENKVFKATSPEMNPQDRIQRVIAVASAGGAPPTGKAKAKATFQVLLPIILTILPLVLL